MQNTTIPAVTTLACVLWSAGGGLVLLGFFRPEPWGTAGLYVGLIAGTVHIRGMLWHMDHREREAFDMGRESVRHIK